MIVLATTVALFMAASPTSYALAGSVVAYTESRLEPADRPPEMIVVRSITTAKVLHKFSLHVENPYLALGEEARALRIFVKDDGAVAWIQEDSFYGHDGGPVPPTAYDVYAVDSGGFRPK